MTVCDNYDSMTNCIHYLEFEI